MVRVLPGDGLIIPLYLYKCQHVVNTNKQKPNFAKATLGRMVKFILGADFVGEEDEAGEQRKTDVYMHVRRFLESSAD